MIRVFVGSPGDVEEERERAFQIIERLNRDPLLPEAWRIEGIGWDKNHYPRISWLSPQEAIHRGIAQPAACDIAVFIFWSRIGTQLPAGSFAPNGAGEQPTGSLWEFHDALEAGQARGWPWVFTYRNMAEPKFDWGRGNAGEFARHIEGVQAFFKGFTNEEGQFEKDYFPYSSLEEFAIRLEADLKAFIKEAQSGQSEEPSARRRHGPKPPGPPPLPSDLLARLKADVGRIELLGLDVNEIPASGLPQIYVPALTRARRTGDEPERSGETPEREGHDLLLHRLGEDSLYLPGDPGTGKSVFCQWVIWALAHGAVPAPSVPPPEAYAETLPASLAGSAQQGRVRSREGFIGSNLSVLLPQIPSPLAGEG
jgi:hypothetical protein